MLYFCGQAELWPPEVKMTKELNRTETVAQIEVTPEMIGAAASVLERYLPYPEFISSQREDVAERILESALEAYLAKSEIDEAG